MLRDIWKLFAVCTKWLFCPYASYKRSHTQFTALIRHWNVSTMPFPASGTGPTLTRTRCFLRVCDTCFHTHNLCCIVRTCIWSLQYKILPAACPQAWASMNADILAQTHIHAFIHTYRGRSVWRLPRAALERFETCGTATGCWEENRNGKRMDVQTLVWPLQLRKRAIRSHTCLERGESSIQLFWHVHLRSYVMISDVGSKLILQEWCTCLYSNVFSVDSQALLQPFELQPRLTK
jgi:hypothetical protein